MFGRMIICMRKASLFIAFTSIILLFIAFFLILITDNKHPIKILVAKSTRSTKESLLSITIENNQFTSVVFNEPDLPWWIRNGKMRINVFANKVLIKPDYTTCDEPPFGMPIKFFAFQSQSKDISLSEYYPNLDKILLTNDIDIIWDYTPSPRGTNLYPAEFGYLRLSGQNYK